MGAHNECACGCCAGVDAETPKRLHNRPGLSVVSYRAGRYADFRESMLARLSSTEFPALAALTVRDDSDFSIALCDAAAVMLDVLSFYQERIVNENFLRTAQERQSILELARLIGYRLSPGVAAASWLAFAVQEAPGLPGQRGHVAQVPAGTRVQSVPGPNEQPQTFESVESIEARATWNAMPVQTSAAWLPQRGDTDLYLAGVSTGLASGDALLIVGQERQRDPGSERWDVRIVSTVETDVALGHTRVRWLEGLGSHTPPVLPAHDSPRVYVLRQRAALFGHNAPDPRMMSTRDTQLGTLVTGTGENMTWKNYQVTPGRIDLDAAYPRITANSWVALVSNDPSIGSGSLPGYTELVRVKDVSVASRTGFGLSGRITRITPDVTEHFDSSYFTIPRTLVLAQSEELTVAPRQLRYPMFGAAIALPTVQDALRPTQALALSGKPQRIAIADGVKGLSLAVEGAGSVAVAAGDSLQMDGPPLRRLGGQVYAMTPEELGAAIGKATALRLAVRDRDGTAGTIDVLGNQILLAPALDRDAVVSEVVFIDSGEASIEHRRDGSVLHLDAATRHVYDRPTVRINANVARATHGETVTETLGSGAADVPNQRFTLRQLPLTHVSAATPSGRASSLALRVNDLLWTEVPSLYGHGPTDRVFTTSIDDAGHSDVVFGDGVEGARPPTGRDNVRAVYRKGLGAGGNVEAGALGNLLTRPLGVSGVTNPEAASGGQDPETRDAARQNAPRTVLTLDRAVSIRDYEDFARSFAGIAKAHASWIAAGPGRGVFVTVAGDAASPVLASSDTYTNLLAALRRYGDALVPLRVTSFRAAAFRLRVAVKVAPDAEIEPVRQRCHDALLIAFGFDARRFGQQVSVDEVAAVLHGVPSVIAVNVLELFRPDQGATPKLEARLFARLPETSLAALPLPAELLMIDAAALRVEVMP